MMVLSFAHTARVTCFLHRRGQDPSFCSKRPKPSLCHFLQKYLHAAKRTPGISYLFKPSASWVERKQLELRAADIRHSIKSVRASVLFSFFFITTVFTLLQHEGFFLVFQPVSLIHSLVTIRGSSLSPLCPHSPTPPSSSCRIFFFYSLSNSE